MPGSSGDRRPPWNGAWAAASSSGAQAASPSAAVLGGGGSSASAYGVQETVPAGRPPVFNKPDREPVGRLAGPPPDRTKFADPELLEPEEDAEPEGSPPGGPPDEGPPGGGPPAPPPPPPPPPVLPVVQPADRSRVRKSKLEKQNMWKVLRDCFLYYSCLSDYACCAKIGFKVEMHDTVRAYREGWAQIIFAQVVTALWRLALALAFCGSNCPGFGAMFGVLVVAWDETPGYFSAYANEGAASVQSINQVMLTIVLFSALVRYHPDGPLADPKHVIMIGDLPMPLLSLGAQTGDVISHALNFLLRLVGAFFFLEQFRHTVQVLARDRAGANGRVVKDREVRFERGESRGLCPLDMGCRQHDLHHVNGEGLQSLPRLLPRMVKACAALDTAAVRNRFEAALDSYLDDPEHFKYYLGSQPAGEARDFREGALRAFWIKRGAGRASDRELEFICVMCNGDWRLIGVIEHYCPGPSCCRGEDDARQKLRVNLKK